MITAYFDSIRQTLILDELVESFKVLREMTGNNDGFIRVKCRLADGSILEFAEYAQIEAGRISRQTYSYHWQTRKGVLLKRWDNAPHHPEIATFPDHLHKGDVITESKPMTLALVLIAIGNTLSGANK
jgi:hypothetical protein